MVVFMVIIMVFLVPSIKGTVGGGPHVRHAGYGPDRTLSATSGLIWRTTAGWVGEGKGRRVTRRRHLVGGPVLTKRTHWVIYVVDIEQYLYLVPFVTGADGTRFLMTIIPSRKATRDYQRRSS